MSTQSENKAAQPWEQLDHESGKMYRLAKAFFELGPERSLKALAKVTGLKQTTLCQYASRFKWSQRARAYDRHYYQIEQKQKEQVLSEVARDDAEEWVRRVYENRETMWKVSSELLARAQEMLSTPLDQMRWSARDVATFSTTALHLSQSIEKAVAEANTEREPSHADMRITVQYVDM